MIIDNASIDNSVNIAKQICPECIIIQTGLNLGFGRAVNVALKTFHAQRYLILNPDTEITNNIIQNMLAHMNAHPDVGVVGCRMINEDGSIQHNTHSLPGLFVAVSHLLQLKRIMSNRYLRHVIKFFNWIPSLTEYINYRNVMTFWLNVEVVPGSCFLIDGGLFVEMGGFDENIFLYYEDIDLFYRICRQKNREIHLLPDTGVVHHCGKSFNSEFTNISPYKYWSMLYYYKKNHGRIAYYFVSFVLLLTTSFKYTIAFFHSFSSNLERNKYLDDCISIIKLALFGLKAFNPFIPSYSTRQ